MYTYIHIYMYRERERERDTHIHVYAHLLNTLLRRPMIWTGGAIHRYAVVDVAHATVATVVTSRLYGRSVPRPPVSSISCTTHNVSGDALYLLGRAHGHLQASICSDGRMGIDAEAYTTVSCMCMYIPVYVCRCIYIYIYAYIYICL